MFKKVPRKKIAKKQKASPKGGGLAQAFAATKKVKASPPEDFGYDFDADPIPMEHFRNGKPRPRASQCTCKRAPNKYCWVHKKWAARPDIAPSEDVIVDLWAAWEEGKVLPELL